MTFQVICRCQRHSLPTGKSHSIQINISQYSRGTFTVNGMKDQTFITEPSLCYTKREQNGIFVYNRFCSTSKLNFSTSNSHSQPNYTALTSEHPITIISVDVVHNQVTDKCRNNCHRQVLLSINYCKYISYNHHLKINTVQPGMKKTVQFVHSRH